MRTLTLDMPTDMYQRLAAEASRLGQLPQVMALEWLSTRLAPPPSTVTSDRTEVREILRAAGLLSELGPELQRRADPTISLDEVIAELDQAGGKPLSEIIIEQRRSREWGLSTSEIAHEEEDIGGQALRAAGLLTELSPGLSALADPTVRLEDVIAAMARAEGPSLSELVLEERRSSSDLLTAAKAEGLTTENPNLYP